MKYQYDCIVVGSGHAGSSAAYAAVQSGCKRGEGVFHLWDASF